MTGTIKVFPEKKTVQLPRLGELRVKEIPTLAETARILSTTVSRTADRWYVALTVEEEVSDSPKNEGQLIALDKGLNVFSATCIGIPILKPKFLLKQLRKLRKLSISLSRKKIGSNNRRKAAEQLARFHRKVKNTRHDFLHKLSTHLAKNHSIIVVEDLWIIGLIKNKKLSKYWTGLAHGEFQRMLDYKAKLYGAQVIEADRFFPSSKLCSNCLYYNPDLTLKDRVYQCPLCGLELDRDFNASLNLENYYYIYQVLIDPVAKSSEETLNAGGEPVRLPHRKLDSMKQEAQCHLS